MGRLLPVLLPGLLVLLAATLPVRGGQGERSATDAASAAPGADSLEVEAVSLSELRENPAHYLGRRIRFVLQFQETVEDWNPFLSCFGPADWTAFRAWPDEKFTWDAEVYEDPGCHLFVRRGSRPADVVHRARRYARMRVLARVREVFLDEPWIEVESLEPLREEVGEGTLLHVTRALDLIERGQFALALTQLDRARAAPLPLHAREEIERMAGECRRTEQELAATGGLR